MPGSLIDSIGRVLSPELVGRAANAIGESPEATGRAFAAATQAILGGVVRGASDDSIMAQVFNAVRSPSNDGAVLRDPDSILGVPRGRTSGFADLGNEFLRTVFGVRLSRLSDALASHAGIRHSSAPSILGMTAPLVLAALGDRTRRDQLDLDGLRRLVIGDRGALSGSLPASLIHVLDEASPSATGSRQTASSRVSPSADARAGRWIWPVVGAAALAGIWLFTRGNPDRMVNTAMGTLDSVPATESAVAAPASEPADLLSLTLPGGVELNAPPDGIEHRLLQFIEDPDVTVNDTSWFDFDRLNFETGSVTLRPGSRDQLQNVATILKAYPKVSIRIGGYTDNTGNAEANLRLSQERAEAVRRELEILGIAPIRLSAAGYGDQYPVADNASAEGRARNRRIALRVTEK